MAFVIGQMRERIKVQYQYIEQNANLENQVQWINLYECWAKVEASRGDKFEQVGSAVEKQPFIAHIRFKDGKNIGISNRVIMRGKAFDIQSVVEVDYTRDMWELHLIENKRVKI